MAKKKSRGKGKSKGARKAEKKSNGDEGAVSAAGDLRLVPLHCEAWANGSAQAAEALMTLGRDASYQVIEWAQAHKNGELEELGRRLVAVPSRIDTNLYQLRLGAVSQLLDQAKEAAPLATDAHGVSVSGGAVALFDPARVAADLAKSGRPRKELARLEGGDVACFGLATPDATPVVISTEPVPDGQATARLRLRVDSGVVFVGPPEASDGPRLGAVRLDPHRTGLHDHLERGAFVRVKPGTYAVHAYLAADGRTRVHLKPDPDVRAPLGVSAGAPPPLPVAPSKRLDHDEPGK